MNGGLKEVTIIKQIITENLETSIISLMEPKLTWKDTVNTMRLTQEPSDSTQERQMNKERRFLKAILSVLLTSILQKADIQKVVV